MNIEQMREHIAQAYPGRNWKARCSMMSDGQVIAVYRSISERKAKRGVLRIKDPLLGTSQVKKSTKPGYQFTIFDYGVEKEA